MSAKRPSLAESMRQVAQNAPPEGLPLSPPAALPVPRPTAAPSEIAAKGEEAPKPARVPTPKPQPPAKAAAAASGFYAATRAGKKKVTVALDPATHKRLKALSVEREVTTEALLQEAIADLFRKHG